MYKLAHALIICLTIALASGTAALDQRAAGHSWTWDSYAWDFLVCAAC